MSSLEGLAEYIDHFRLRVLQDALAEATSAYWQQRAAQFEAAKPRPGDYPGRATPEQLERRRVNLAYTALACRERAAIAHLMVEVDSVDEITQALREAS